MSVSVRIPTTLRTLTGGRSEVSLEGSNVRDVLTNLDGAHPGFAARLLDDDGNLRRFVNVFVADDDIRFLDGLDTKVPDGAEVSIIPAVAGG
ncbi:MAG: MoaD/ThiS family protein [Acidimicrobiales bacterium]|nr:MoaD/ThiS family protein [Acidimicrobiales bacterium]